MVYFLIFTAVSAALTIWAITRRDSMAPRATAVGVMAFFILGFLYSGLAAATARYEVRSDIRYYKSCGEPCNEAYGHGHASGVRAGLEIVAMPALGLMACLGVLALVPARRPDASGSARSCVGLGGEERQQ